MKTKTVILDVKGMSCQACATRIEKILNKQPAIVIANVNFANETVHIEFNAQQTNVTEMMDWITKAGFSAQMPMVQQQDVDKSSPPISLYLLWLCLLPFLLGMAGMLMGRHDLMLPIWLQFGLASFVQFGLAIPFYQRAWVSIVNRFANMDVLVVLGTFTIWAYSTYVWLFTDQVAVYFESGVMVLAFVSLGKFLEQRTKKQSLNSIQLLLSLTPQQVDVRNVHGEWQSLDVSLVKVGHVVLAKQGSRIACDGVVVAGNGWCDESHLTGESVILEKQKHSLVLAGAMVSQGSFAYQVTATGEQTQLGDMIKALNDAQSSKAPIARIADRVAGVFVPVVLVLAVLTFIGNFWLLAEFDVALMRAVAVLVIACPCALGLATPSAIMAGMGVASRHGVWFKNAQALEQCGNIDTVVLDKTGTLTEGRPKLVAHYIVDNGLKFEDILTLVASVEQNANHPLATALCQVAKKLNQTKNKPFSLFSVTNVKTIAGQGIQAEIADFGLVKVGSLAFTNMSLPKNLLQSNDVWQIASTVAVSVNDMPLAAFALADSLKSDSHQMVQQLQKNGLDVIIMSGDKTSVVEYVAKKLQIHQAFGELNPRQKAEKIQQLQNLEKKVVMVGDGINDTAAMAVANASFAIFQGADIATHQASARLMGHSLIHIDHAIYIAKATLRHIKQNLFFAFIYNVIGIGLAAIGLLNPMIAGMAMAFSSISVLMNALRLNKLNRL